MYVYINVGVCLEGGSFGYGIWMSYFLCDFNADKYIALILIRRQKAKVIPITLLYEFSTKQKICIYNIQLTRWPVDCAFVFC